MERKTRIVATVGPATSADDRLVGLVEAGADVLRVNFSHGEPAQQADLIGRIRSVLCINYGVYRLFDIFHDGLPFGLELVGDSPVSVCDPFKSQ